MAEDLFIGNKPGGLLNWTKPASSEPLTEETFLGFMRKLKERSDAYRRAPKGPCGCPACVVHPTTRERLLDEGGWARCGNCGNAFHIEPCG